MGYTNMWKNKLSELLKVNYPIIQAPMAGGPTSPELVSAVSNAGGLGMVGAGYMSPEQLQIQIKTIRKLTDKPFGVNLFVPSTYSTNVDNLERAMALLQPIKDQYNITNQLTLPTFEQDCKTFLEHINIIIEEKVPICSFTFGVPTQEVIKKLKESSVILIGTATTVQEAIINEQVGMDAVVVQGVEAGGHRGTFHHEDKRGLVGLMSLIPQTADSIRIPLIAAGGIMDGRGICAANILGALGVQMGTAFLVCEESGAHPLHKEAILLATEEQAVLTKAFSGKMARGINNSFIEILNPYEDELPDYPIQNELTKTIRKASSSMGKKDCMSLWSGQSPRLAKRITVKELMERLKLEMDSYCKRS